MTLLALCLALGSAAMAEEKPKPAGKELVETAKAWGRGDTRVPPVNGICVDEKGKTAPCAVSADGPLYSARITGNELCRDAIQQALDDLREEILARVRSGERTGNAYYDRFVLFLAEQFAGKGKGKDLPTLEQGPPGDGGDLGTYDPRSKVVSIGPEFCELSRTERRKLLGHGIFHHWDNGLDGNPLPPRQAAERPAFGIMPHL
jgi:hypothetical protein